MPAITLEHSWTQWKTLEGEDYEEKKKTLHGSVHITLQIFLFCSLSFSRVNLEVVCVRVGGGGERGRNRDGDLYSERDRGRTAHTLLHI